MKHNNILNEAVKLKEREYSETIKNIDPTTLEFYVESNGKYFTLKEKRTGIVIFKTFDEDYADETCDSFNMDKDVGKDALVDTIEKFHKK